MLQAKRQSTKHFMIRSFSKASLFCFFVTCFAFLSSSFTREAQATTMIKLSELQLVQVSSFIVRGKVTQKRSVWAPNKMGIITLVTFKVDEEVLGRKASRYVTIRHAGGTVGSTTIRIPGAPAFLIGQEYIVVLESSKYLPKGEYLLTGWRQGVWSIYRPQPSIKQQASLAPLVKRSTQGIHFYQPSGHIHQVKIKPETLSGLVTRLRTHWKTVQLLKKKPLLQYKPVAPKLKRPQVKKPIPLKTPKKK